MSTQAVKRFGRGNALRALLKEAETKGAVMMPGAFNGLVARAVAQEGFSAAYISGAGVAASMGLPDIGLVGIDDIRRAVRDVSTSSGLPVIADADTGFGEFENIPRVVYEYTRAGAAGFHIEDQVFPKMCGHLDGKACVPAADFAIKIKTAARTRDELGEGFIVCARTDSRSTEGLEGTIERAKRYVDAGADMIFPEGLHSEAEFGKVAEALRGYNGGSGPFLLANMTEFGKTPMFIPASRFSELGYHCIIFPMTLFRVAMGGIMRTLKELKRTGFVGLPTCEGMMNREQTYHLLGYTPAEPWNFPMPNAEWVQSSGDKERTKYKQGKSK